MSRRVLALLAAIALVQGLAYSLIVPLWQAPDEPGHFEVARLISDLGRLPTVQDVSLPLQREIIGSMARARFWRFTRQAWPEPLPTSFADDSFLRRAGRQVGRQPPLYYIVPALAFRVVRGVDAQARVARLYSVLLSVLTVLAAGWGARQAFEGDLLLAVGVPATLALAPMVAFVGSAVNNDGLANLASALVWAALVAAFRHGVSRRRALALAGATFLALASKRTTWFLFPTLLAAGPLYLWARGRRLSRNVVKTGLLAGLLVLALLAGLRLGSAAGAAAWRVRPTGGLALASPEATLGGSRGLLLRDDSPTVRLRAEQVRGATRLRQREVVFGGTVRALDSEATACLALSDEGSRSETCAKVGAAWERLSVTHTVAADAVLLYASLGVGAWGDLGARGAVAWDDLELVPGTEEENLLANPGAEARGSLWEDVTDRLERALRLPPDVWRRLREPASYDRSALARYGLYLLLTFAGFWGNFGWLQVPLRLVWYEALALICAAALLGWVRLGWRAAARKSGKNADQSRADRAIGALFAVGIVGVMVQTFLPMIGRDWQPQGRYLFPALIPIAAWLLKGLGAWMPPRARPAFLISWLAVLFLLNAVALVETVYPYFHPPLPGEKVF